MTTPLQPADENEEHAKGRVALWLDPGDLRWLSEHCGCAPEADSAIKERCARIRFRAHAALHKSGLKKEMN